MRLVFAATLLVHALVHGYAFASAFGFDARLQSRALGGRGEPFDAGGLASLLLGMCWGGLGAAIAVAGVAGFFATTWWPGYAATVLVASLGLCTVEWKSCPAARVGALVNVVLLAMLWSSYLLAMVL